VASLALALVVVSPSGAAAASKPGSSAFSNDSTDSPAPPSQLTSGSNVTSQVEGDIVPTEGLESMVDTWGLGCTNSEPLDLGLGYVADAMNQGNFLGAQMLLSALRYSVDSQAQAGLLSAADQAQFDQAETSLQAAVPSQGYDSVDFDPTAPSPAIQAPTGCGSVVLANLSLENPNASETKSFWDVVKILLAGALHEVPEVGGLLAALVEICWPEKEENNVTWDQMQEYVEKAVNEAIDNKTKEDLEATLKGLERVLHNYVVVVGTPTPWDQATKNNILTNYVSALNLLEHDEPAFQPGTRPYLVLAEYGVMQNMLLAQLRDGIVNGSKFDLSPVSIADYKTQIANQITDATKYVDPQLDAMRKALPNPPSGPHHNIEVYNQKANLNLKMTPAISDIEFYWQYLDPVKYPNPITPVNKRILYTPSYGLIPDANLPKFDGESKAPIVHFTVWGYDRVDAFQLTYGIGSKPDPRMGDQEYCDPQGHCSGGTNNPPHGGSFQAALVGDGHGWITTVSGYSGDVPESFRLVFDNKGTVFDSGTMGANKNSNFSLSFPGEVLAYALIPGVAGPPYGSANGVILGFRYVDSY
jgi:delta endotoxin, N-terminal domain